MGFIPVKFTHELRYSLIGFKIFGLAPYSDKQSWNVALLLYSTFLVALTLLCACSAFFLADIFSSQASTGTLASIIGQLMFCGLVATSLINLLQAVIFREEATQLEERLDTIHSLMTEKLFIEISCAHIQRRLCWKIFAIVLFLIVVYGANFYALAHYNESVGYNLHSLWPIVIIRARCIHNIFQVDLITVFLNFLNAKLEAIVEISSRHKPTDQFEQIKYAQAEFKHLTRSPYTELMILKDVYGYVWDITNLINDAFGWSLLAVATQNFIEFTCNGYWLFLATDNQLSEMSAINAICTIIPVVFVLANIAYSCYCAIDAGTKTGSLIHQLEKETHRKDDMHNALVREFSLQVAHEPIAISANGFFNIDFSLLGSMAAATVTYLVILIQFQQSEKNKTA